MNDVTVIDRFLDTFSRYIDSGFGLLHGEVAFLTATLVVSPSTHLASQDLLVSQIGPERATQFRVIVQEQTVECHALVVPAAALGILKPLSLIEGLTRMIDIQWVGE